MTDNTWNWIPASKPPANTRLVIVWMEVYGLRLAYFNIGAWHWMDAEIIKVKVTHWCEPLPPPPKPEPREWWCSEYHNGTIGTGYLSKHEAEHNSKILGATQTIKVREVLE